MLRLVITLSLTAWLCGCGSSSDDGDDRPLGQFTGTWQGALGLAQNTCGLNVPNQFGLQVSIEQPNVSHVIVETLVCAPPFEGQVQANSFAASQTAGIADCGEGRQGTLRNTIEFSNVLAGQARSVRTIQEVVCPQDTCRVVFAGTASRTSQDRTPCTPAGGGSSSSAAPTPTPQPTAVPTGCGSCDLSGCCTEHGGVAECLGSGMVRCQDQTFSAACRCD